MPMKPHSQPSQPASASAGSAPSGRPPVVLDRAAVDAARRQKAAEKQKRKEEAQKKAQQKAAGGGSVKESRRDSHSHSHNSQSHSQTHSPLIAGKSAVPADFAFSALPGPALPGGALIASASGSPSLHSQPTPALPSLLPLQLSTSAPSAAAQSQSQPQPSSSQSGHAIQFDDPRRLKKFEKSRVVTRPEVAQNKQVQLFSHLPQYERGSSISLQVGFSSEEIHPAILRLGLQFSAGTISGSNARCSALLVALKEFLLDYEPAPDRLIRDDLLSKLKPLIRFLIDCRPQSISMGNAIRFLKLCISRLSPAISAAEAKQEIIEEIQNFLQSRILLADEVIATYGASKINSGETILVYSHSHVVEGILLRAKRDGKEFKVILVDSRPKFEGRELLKRLTKEGIRCSYCLINSLSYVMQRGGVDKVFLGASALLVNGVMVGRVGSAVVSMMCRSFNIPLLVCCETYKFHERVQLDSICANELGDPDDLMRIDRESGRVGVLKGWREQERLKLLNLMYDLTPAQLINMIITENGMIPPTSVPVILREYHQSQSAAPVGPDRNLNEEKEAE